MIVIHRRKLWIFLLLFGIIRNNYIEYFCPNTKIKEDKKKIFYEVDEDQINYYYKIKTEDLYSLTKNVVEFFKENKNN